MKQVKLLPQNEKGQVSGRGMGEGSLGDPEMEQGWFMCLPSL